eukprot:gene3534-2485_t
MLIFPATILKAAFIPSVKCTPTNTHKPKKPKTHHKTIMSQYCNTTLPNLHASMSTLNTCKQIQPVNYLTRRTHKLPKLVRTGNHQQHNNITDPPQRTTST